MVFRHRVPLLMLFEVIGNSSAAPTFSEENCQHMFGEMLKLGGTVPPSSHVAGCTEVCEKVKSLKDYWKTGDMATLACKKGQAFGCVWPETPPLTLKDVGC